MGGRNPKEMGETAGSRSAESQRERYTQVSCKGSRLLWQPFSGDPGEAGK